MKDEWLIMDGAGRRVAVVESYKEAVHILATFGHDVRVRMVLVGIE